MLLLKPTPTMPTETSLKAGMPKAMLPNYLSKHKVNKVEGGKVSGTELIHI